MKQLIETERLILRELSSLDSESFFELNADPEVMKYTGDKPFSSVLEAEHFLMNYSDYKRNGYGRWAVIAKDTNKFLGWCGLKLNEENLVDIGFRFFRNQWGNGYATEAAKATLQYGFNHLNIEEIVGRASKNNKASINVLQKLGMHFWKKDNSKGLENAVYYKINKTHYNSR